MVELHAYPVVERPYMARRCIVSQIAGYKFPGIRFVGNPVNRGNLLVNERKPFLSQLKQGKKLDF